MNLSHDYTRVAVENILSRDEFFTTKSQADVVIKALERLRLQAKKLTGTGPTRGPLIGEITWKDYRSGSTPAVTLRSILESNQPVGDFMGSVGWRGPYSSLPRIEIYPRHVVTEDGETPIYDLIKALTPIGYVKIESGDDLALEYPHWNK